MRFLKQKLRRSIRYSSGVEDRAWDARVPEVPKVAESKGRGMEKEGKRKGIGKEEEAEKEKKRRREKGTNGTPGPGVSLILSYLILSYLI